MKTKKPEASPKQPATILIRDVAELLGVALPSIVRAIRNDPDFPKRVIVNGPSNLLRVDHLLKWCESKRPGYVPRLHEWCAKRGIILDKQGNAWRPSRATATAGHVADSGKRKAA